MLSFCLRVKTQESCSEEFIVSKLNKHHLLISTRLSDTTLYVAMRKLTKQRTRSQICWEELVKMVRWKSACGFSATKPNRFNCTSVRVRLSNNPWKQRLQQRAVRLCTNLIIRLLVLIFECLLLSVCMDPVVCQRLFSLSRGFNMSSRWITYDPLFKSQPAFCCRVRYCYWSRPNLNQILCYTNSSQQRKSSLIPSSKNNPNEPQPSWFLSFSLAPVLSGEELRTT